MHKNPITLWRITLMFTMSLNASNNDISQRVQHFVAFKLWFLSYQADMIQEVDDYQSNEDTCMEVDWHSSMERICDPIVGPTDESRCYPTWKKHSIMSVKH
jgi:hypothetical protein